MKQHILPLLIAVAAMLTACGEPKEKNNVNLDYLAGVYAMTELTSINAYTRQDTTRQMWDVYASQEYMVYEITDNTINRYWAVVNEQIDNNEYKLETVNGTTYICLHGAHAESFGMTSSVLKITLLNKTHLEYEVNALSVDGPQQYVKLIRKE